MLKSQGLLRDPVGYRLFGIGWGGRPVNLRNWKIQGMIHGNAGWLKDYLLVSRLLLLVTGDGVNGIGVC